MTSKRKKILVTAIVLLILPVVAIGAVALGAWVAVRRSLPKIEGEIVLRGLHAQVRIERDGQGVPTIRAGDREDLAFGLGFVHG
jgi:penicillin G amidase